MITRPSLFRRSSVGLAALAAVLAGCSPSDEGSLRTVASEAGPAGPQGPAGAVGADGARGPAGPQGPAGRDGADGARGPAGPQGPQGVTGPAGPQGEVGSAGASSVKIAEQSVCFDPSDNSGPKLCKIGMTGPGGGIVFFIDYFDQYPSFCAEGDCNYLEVANADAGPLDSSGNATHLWCAPTGSTSSISSVVNAGGTYTYTTTAAHNFSLGQSVTIRSVDPAGYNVTAVTIATRPSDTTFTVISQAAGTGAYVSGGTVSSASIGASGATNDAGSYTYTTRFAHGLSVGSIVTTSGILPVGYNISQQVVASVPTDTTFTVTGQAAGTGAYTADTGHVLSLLSPGTSGSSINANSAVGAGRANTEYMLSGTPTRCVAGAAVVANEYSTAQAAAGSWWLPSLGELMLMYTSLRQAGAGGFSTTIQFSWSSSEDNLRQAWVQGFYFGNVFSHEKVGGYRVRPVRGF